MSSMFFVVAIMGCGDGADACRDARVLPARYETSAQCRAALPRQLAANTDIDAPVVQADCRMQGAQTAEQKPPRERG